MATQWYAVQFTPCPERLEAVFASLSDEDASLQTHREPVKGILIEHSQTDAGETLSRVEYAVVADGGDSSHMIVSLSDEISFSSSGVAFVAVVPEGKEVAPYRLEGTERRLHLMRQREVERR